MSDNNPLRSKDVEEFLNNNSDWRFEEDRLKAEFTLADFDKAMLVVEKVAAAARVMDHHPLWTNVYNKLSFSLCTHSAGDKVTKLDLQLAEEISRIVLENCT